MATAQSSSSTWAPDGDDGENRRDQTRQFFFNGYDDSDVDDDVHIELPQLSALVSWPCLGRILYLWRHILGFVVVNAVVCGLWIPHLFHVLLLRQNKHGQDGQHGEIEEASGNVFAPQADRQNDDDAEHDEEWISLLRVRATTLLVVASIMYIVDCLVLIYSARQLEKLTVSDDGDSASNNNNMEEERRPSSQTLELAATTRSPAQAEASGEQSAKSDNVEASSDNDDNDVNDVNQNSDTSSCLDPRGPSSMAARLSLKSDAYLANATSNLMFSFKSGENHRKTTFLASVLWVGAAILFAAGEWTAFATIAVQLPSTNATHMVRCAITNQDYNHFHAVTTYKDSCFTEKSDSEEFTRLPSSIQKWATSLGQEDESKTRHSYVVMKDGSLFFTATQPGDRQYTRQDELYVVQFTRLGTVVEYHELNTTRGWDGFWYRFETSPEHSTSAQPAEEMCGVLWGDEGVWSDEFRFEPFATPFCYTAAGERMRSAHLEIAWGNFGGAPVRFRLHDHRLWIVYAPRRLAAQLVSYSVASWEMEEHASCTKSPIDFHATRNDGPDCNGWQWMRVLHVTASLLAAAAVLRHRKVPQCCVPLGLGAVTVVSHLDEDMALAMMFLLPICGLVMLGTSLRNNEWPLASIISAETFAWFTLTILGGLCTEDEGKGALVALIILVFGGIWVLRHALFDVAAVILLFWSLFDALLLPQRGRWFAPADIVVFHLVLMILCVIASFIARRYSVYLMVLGRRTWRLMRAAYRQWFDDSTPQERNRP